MALALALMSGAIAIGSMKDPDHRVRKTAIVVAILLLVQFSSGIANILLVIPISIAVAHNGIAALLPAYMVSLLFFTKYPEI
jgi:heme a synthase